jgi:hypothetical protein
MTSRAKKHLGAVDLTGLDLTGPPGGHFARQVEDPQPENGHSGRAPTGLRPEIAVFVPVRIVLQAAKQEPSHSGRAVNSGRAEIRELIPELISENVRRGSLRAQTDRLRERVVLRGQLAGQ